MTIAARPRRFSPLIGADQLLNRAQIDVASSIDSILQAPYLNGVLLEGVDLAYGAVNNVEHKLGRKYRGWYVTRVQARGCNFSAYSTGVTSVATGTTTKIDLQAELYDDFDDFDASSAYTFTAPVTGRYDIHAQLAINTLPVGVRMGVGVFVNATAYIGLYVSSSVALNHRANFIRNAFPLTAGDVLYMYGHQASGGALNSVSGVEETTFSIRISGSVEPWEDTTASVDATKYIPLRADRPVTVDLWVF